MTTLTIKINEKSKKGKAFLKFAKIFFTDEKDVEIIEVKEEKSKNKDYPYNPEFVNMVLESASSLNRTRVNSKNLWESI
jgi:hypothetical protein